ncbi:MAG: ATP-binding cassette domain-containing protein [Limnobacter sp.]|nr:ATP-binding cassette domain-containing protein [Limnobacter sp.]
MQFDLFKPMLPNGQSLLPLQLTGICLSLGGKKVLNQISFDTDIAGITAIMGPNGAGKSLLLRLIAGLIRQDAGSVQLGDGQQSIQGHLGFVFQRPVLLRRSVKGNLMHALKLAGFKSEASQLRCAQLLDLGQMTGLANSPARKLSGGEQQRLSLLRALACQPALLLLDEPSASLDPQATFLLEDLVRKASAAGVKVIIVTHDQGQAMRLAQEVVFIHKGQFLEKQNTQAFLKHPQTKQAKAYLAGELLLDHEI